MPSQAFRDSYNFQVQNGARLRQNMLARQAGGMMAEGDTEGARNALYRGGELEAGGQIDTRMATDRKAKAEAASRWAQGLGRMMDDPRFAANPEAAWEAALPFAAKLGLDPKEAEADRALFTRDPKGYASMLLEKAEAEQFTLTPGSARYDASGRQIAAQPLERRPDWRERTLPDGSTEFFDINAEAGGQPVRGTPGFNPSAPPPASAPNADQAVAALTSRGARVTSGVRSPEHNARVGGQPNSYHLPSRGGVARDLVPPAGQSMAQFHAEVKANLPPGWEAINEGDHVHIEPGPGASRQVAQVRPRTVRGDAARPNKGDSAPSGFRWKADGSLEPIPGGPADTISQGGKVTEGERTAGFLASRLADSLKNLTGLSASSPQADKPDLGEVFTDVVTQGRGTNFVRSGERQQVVANQLDVLDAALTLGTGAAYTREQLMNYRETYFPALTDKPATVNAKRQKLIALLNAAKIKAGRSAPPELDEALAAARTQWSPQARAARPAKAPAQAKQSAQGGIPTLTPEQAAKLPRGARFRTTDGRTLVRQ